MGIAVSVLRTPPPATEPRDGPTRNFHYKYKKKIPPGPKFWTPRICPPKMPRRHQKKGPQNTKIVFWVFLAFSRGSRMSAGGYFWGYVFVWKLRLGPSWGSVAGGGVLNFSCEAGIFWVARLCVCVWFSHCSSRETAFRELESSFLEDRNSGTDMTGRPGYRTAEMIGGSSVSYLARTPCVIFGVEKPP